MLDKTVADQAISFDESAELIEQSEVRSKLDLGHSLVYRLQHPEFGDIIVINSSSGSGALLKI